MPKEYKQSTKAIVAEAYRLADEMRAKGMTRENAVESLKSMLETGNAVKPEGPELIGSILQRILPASMRVPKS